MAPRADTPAPRPPRTADGATPGADTAYDIASLTKVVATWPLVGRAVDAGLLGGVAGHAGVFSTARDLARYAAHLVDPAGRLYGWLRTSTRPFAPIGTGLDRGLSWICAPGDVAYHHGFTGTSPYLAPTAGRYLAICTNAVYHGEARRRIAPLRALALKTVTAT
ncbi:serine hydrolase [Streptomyces sp. NPDC004126]|uniref:serine hydrolase n=1 Tax=Streptomyces sp. NPDC004126 TaxID=3390695 RepID=UPI003D06268B